MKFLFPILMAAALPLSASAEDVPPITLTVKPDRNLLLQKGARSAIIQIELQAKSADQKRSSPMNLALVIDRSGSMAGAKLEKALQAAMVALDQLGPNDQFTLIVYSNEAQVLIPCQKVEDKEAIKRTIAKIKANGGTALYAGVEKGAEQLRKYIEDEKISRILLLSDGQANVGPSSPRELAQLGKELRAQGLGVSTVGLGDDYNEDLMTAMAEASRGNYYYVQDVEKLPAIFAEELGTLKSVVARNVKILITLPKGVKASTVLGEEDVVFTGQTLSIPLAEFFGSQTRRFLIVCEAPLEDTKKIELARIELVYDDIAKRETRRENQTAQVEQTNNPDLVESSANADVLANVAIANNVIAKVHAVQLADAGKSSEAAKVLLDQAKLNAALPAVAQSDALKKEDAELKRRALELQSEGSLSKASRKEIQQKNYRDRNQKN